MNRIRSNTAVVGVLLLCVVFLATDFASAHRVNVFAWVEGDTVHVESKFAGGKKVKTGKIIVKDRQGNELLKGITDDQGEFSFKVPKRTDLKIVLIAGQGHQAEWTIRAVDMEELPAKTASGTSVEQPIKAERNKAAPKEASSDTMTAAPDSVMKPEELEQVIETVLDRKLKPITRMLADLRQKGPTPGDILAGIGYILGLVGIAMYVQNRKKKK